MHPGRRIQLPPPRRITGLAAAINPQIGSSRPYRRVRHGLVLPVLTKVWREALQDVHLRGANYDTGPQRQHPLAPGRAPAPLGLDAKRGGLEHFLRSQHERGRPAHVEDRPLHCCGRHKRIATTLISGTARAFGGGTAPFGACSPGMILSCGLTIRVSSWTPLVHSTPDGERVYKVAHVRRRPAFKHPCRLPAGAVEERPPPSLQVHHLANGVLVDVWEAIEQ
mmetsp:Transcript_19726/g.59828  ORF Transcript_19726/g.59828 Transcript_19726/m.59828 type:complete len:223 (+) Transcript_19726:3111-3779(+)|eukprot:scaffold13607_cov35-Tisochrysis_lutea.AAC.4